MYNVGFSEFSDEEVLGFVCFPGVAKDLWQRRGSHDSAIHSFEGLQRRGFRALGFRMWG